MTGRGLTRAAEAGTWHVAGTVLPWPWPARSAVFPDVRLAGLGHLLPASLRGRFCSAQGQLLPDGRLQPLAAPPHPSPFPRLRPPPVARVCLPRCYSLAGMSPQGQAIPRFLSEVAQELGSDTMHMHWMNGWTDARAWVDGRTDGGMETPLKVFLKNPADFEHKTCGLGRAWGGGTLPLVTLIRGAPAP